MNFEVNDVTANILNEFQQTVDNALFNVENQQNQQSEQLQKIINEKTDKTDLQKELTAVIGEVEKNREEIKKLSENVAGLYDVVNSIQSQLEKNEGLLRRMALRLRRIR